ncbi:MAG: GTP-sensing pleiotropic transcriptional regulator CodY [Anaerofustis stercorihominis]|nr:GTP-sensing pleiotropic transcriptional regulator CodY [Anaerofustis stercorihominis]
MQELLIKIRKLNEILKRSAIEDVSFKQLSKEISDILDLNCYVVDIVGNILAYETSTKYDCKINNDNLESVTSFDDEFNSQLMSCTDTEPNMYLKNPKCTYGDKGDCIFTDRYLTVIPIFGLGKRLGSFVLCKYGEEFSMDDIIMCEYASAIIAMEMLKNEEENYKNSIAQKTTVKMAFSTLSYSELSAVKLIIKELDGEEGHIVASVIAEEVGITRSVISNALRKLESAGVIQTRSLGMKGTYIKIINPFVTEEINN